VQSSFLAVGRPKSNSNFVQLCNEGCEKNPDVGFSVGQTKLEWLLGQVDLTSYKARLFYKTKKSI